MVIPPTCVRRILQKHVEVIPDKMQAVDQDLWPELALFYDAKIDAP
jgi:hypothetical protein